MKSRGLKDHEQIDIRRNLTYKENTVQSASVKMPAGQVRVHHRDLGNDDRNQDKISYSAIVNKSIMKPLWNKTSSASSLLTTIPKSQNDNEDKFSQAMYKMTSMQLKSNIRCTNIPQNIPRRRTSTSTTIKEVVNYNAIAPSLTTIVLATALILIPLANASSDNSGSDVIASPASSSAITSSINNRQDVEVSINRRDSSNQASSSEKNSIVASLSSAVASAAAAAAVAAAQNSLSSNDARSLLSSSGQSHITHHQRSPGLNLAIKLVDTIPEVPYNILHNMKKLDHAAPFYNVPGRISHSLGAGKESSHSRILSALTAPGALGGAADQLSSLFRSPLWKRIADGYGEFTSEFRSLFRAKPTTMKGPTSSTSKLLRDISVPAILLLLATGFSNDWKPASGARRKSLASDTNDLSMKLRNLDPLSMSASESVQNYALGPQMFKQQALTNPNYSPIDSRPFLNQIDQSGSVSALGQQIASAAAINAPPSGSVGVNWVSPTSGQTHMMPIDKQQQFGKLEDQEATMGQPQQVVKRLGESSDPSSLQNVVEYQPKYLKPVTSDYDKIGGASFYQAQPRDSSMNAGPLSSLTSQLAKLAVSSRFINANSDRDNNHFRMMPMPSKNERGLLSSMFSRKNQLLSDKHLYSVDSHGDGSEPAWINGNMNEQKSSSSASSKPFSYSSSILSRALNILSKSSPNRSGSTDFFNEQNDAKNSLDTINHINDHGSSMTIGDKTINQGLPPVMIRREMSGQQSSPLGQEQRDLTQLLPQSWREVVKRTVNSVKQEASTGWRTIEGQVTNWVQDKLKTLPNVSTQQQSLAGNSVSASSGSPIAVSGQPVSNLIASVSSTAMNILGLGSKNIANSANKVASQPAAVSDLVTSGSESTSTTAKNDTPNKSMSQTSKGGALANVASLIVNTLTNRQTYASASQKPANIDESQSSSSSGAKSSVVSQYPTVTGAQPSSQSSSATSGTST